MPARHWRPPAFLLPSWTEPQLALAQRSLLVAAAPLPTTVSSWSGRGQYAALHDNSRSDSSLTHSSRREITRTPSSGTRRRNYDSERARNGQQQGQRRWYSSAATGDERQLGHSYDNGWGHEAADGRQRAPRTRKSATSKGKPGGLKVKYFIKRDAGAAEWSGESKASPKKEVNRLLELNSRRKGNGKHNDARSPLAGATERAKKQDEVLKDNDHGISSKNESQDQSNGTASLRGRPESRLMNSEARTDSKSIVALDGDRSQAPSALKSRVYSPLLKTSKPLRSPAPQLEREREPSLLEELFPELAAQQAAGTRNSSVQREVPRLRIADISISSSTDPEDDELPSTSQSRTRPAAGGRAVEKHVEDEGEVAVLVFRTWDTSLSEADFQRVVPRGSHIEEWRERGSFIQVIPVRRSPSLAPVGHYLLLFRNAEYREAYRRSAERLAALSARSAPGSIEGAYLKTPQDRSRGGESRVPDGGYGDEDADVLLNEYALTPRPRIGAAAPLFFQDSSVRASKALMRLVEHRGYEKIAGRAGRVLLFWVDGYGPLDSEVHRMLRVDGRDRGIAWTATGRIERLELLKGSDKETDEFGDSGYFGDMDSEANGKKSYHKWLMEFDDETEARRFIRNWHLREWPLSPERKSQHSELDAIIHAELLW